MFLQFEQEIKNKVGGKPYVKTLFDLSPAELIGRLEEYWVRRYPGANRYSDKNDQDQSRLSSANPFAMRAVFSGQVGAEDPAAVKGEQHRQLYVPSSAYSATPLQVTIWDHLIFAYLLEVTYLYEIFARVVFEYTTGVRRDILEPDALRWLTSTEALFFTNPLPYSVLGLTSDLHRDIRGIRATDYARIFGMPVTHPVWDSSPFPKPLPGAANVDFVPTLEEFLREVWIGVSNAGNTSGPNDTDDSAIARLARRLYDMLVTARHYGWLDRHEFVHVTTFSWFYLTLLDDYPIIRQLKAEASSPYERLQNVAARVGMVPHSRTEQFFALADDLPMLLRIIETGALNTPEMAAALYSDPTKQNPPLKPNPLRKLIQEVTTNWSIATGRDLKAAVTAPSRIRAELATSRYGSRRVQAARTPELTTGAVTVPAATASANGLYASALGSRPIA